MKNSYFFKKLSDEVGCVYFITTKDSQYSFDFSLALHTGETSQDIISNRKLLEQKFPNMRFVVANQTHSSNISVISTSQNIGWQDEKSAISNCDAMITNQKGVMLTILTADCVPILLFDKRLNIVSAIHAGWRGTEQQIVIKTVQKMINEFGSNPSDIIAGVAPSIGRCCYEVDWGVAQHFSDYQNAFDKVGDKYMLDLPHINRLQLLEVGLSEENIELSNICTACEVNSYFSYRKENGCSGRFMSMIGIS